MNFGSAQSAGGGIGVDPSQVSGGNASSLSPSAFSYPFPNTNVSPQPPPPMPQEQDQTAPNPPPPMPANADDDSTKDKEQIKRDQMHSSSSAAAALLLISAKPTPREKARLTRQRKKRAFDPRLPSRISEEELRAACNVVRASDDPSVRGLSRALGTSDGVRKRIRLWFKTMKEDEAKGELTAREKELYAYVKDSLGLLDDKGKGEEDV